MAQILTNTGAAVDLVLRQGAQFSKSIVHKTNGVVTNLAGYTFASQIRTAGGTLAATPTCTVVNAGSGIFSVTISAAAIAGLTVGTTYYWELESTNGGITNELASGQVSVLAG